MPTAAQALARNLAQKRQERGISLSELARRSGVSKATLSGLERGTGNPSIETVWLLAEALNAHFGDLFDDDGQDLMRVRRIEDAQLVTSEEGFEGRRMLSCQGGTESYMLDLDADVTRRVGPHAAGVIEHVIVWTGRAEVGPEGESTILGAGDSLTFSADRPHVYAAIDGPARLLSIAEYP
jgi:transcriptional regulator with XRE-family HTH domain